MGCLLLALRYLWLIFLFLCNFVDLWDNLLIGQVQKAIFGGIHYQHHLWLDPNTSVLDVDSGVEFKCQPRCCLAT